MNAEIRRQEKIDMVEERDFRKGELLGKFIVKMLYGWDDGKFKEEYLKKLERNWRRKGRKQFLQRRNLKGGVMSRSKKVDLIYFIFILFSIYFSTFYF